MMKVFISHKQEDSLNAKRVQEAFAALGVSSYLDVLDDTLVNSGESLTDHIKKQLNTCTDIIVVMSEATRYSWWVPFEIGMAAQLDMPTATFLTSYTKLPEYLEDWPRLKSTTDIATYVLVRYSTASQIQKNFAHSYSQQSLRAVETRNFHKNLKQKLR